MNISKKEYDVAPESLYGYEKIASPGDILTAKVLRMVVEPDETQYKINADGEPELTTVAQDEYDGFLQSLRERFCTEDWSLVAEGFGEGEDELEYHVTAVVKQAGGGSAAVETCVVVRIW